MIAGLGAGVACNRRTRICHFAVGGCPHVRDRVALGIARLGEQATGLAYFHVNWCHEDEADLRALVKGNLSIQVRRLVARNGRLDVLELFGPKVIPTAQQVREAERTDERQELGKTRESHGEGLGERVSSIQA